MKNRFDLGRCVAGEEAELRLFPSFSHTFRINSQLPANLLYVSAFASQIHLDSIPLSDVPHPALDFRSLAPCGKALPMLKMFRPPGPAPGPPGMPLAPMLAMELKPMKSNSEDAAGERGGGSVWVGRSDHWEEPIKPLNNLGVKH